MDDLAWLVYYLTTRHLLKTMRMLSAVALYLAMPVAVSTGSMQLMQPSILQYIFLCLAYDKSC